MSNLNNKILVLNKYLFEDLRKSCDKFHALDNYLIVFPHMIEEIKLCAWSYEVTQLIPYFKRVTKNGKALLVNKEKSI